MKKWNEEVGMKEKDVKKEKEKKKAVGREAREMKKEKNKAEGGIEMSIQKKEYK